MNEINRHRYDDIIDLPHPVSKIHPPMPRGDRAAQFSPFAALTGYEGEIEETARLTERRKPLDEEQSARLERRLQILAEKAAERPEVEITYFLPDERKAGGAYVTVRGSLRRIDEYEKTIVLADGRRIPIAEIAELRESGLHEKETE